MDDTARPEHLLGLARTHEARAALFAAHGRFAEAFTEHQASVAALTRQLRAARAETAEARQQAAHFREQARRDPLTGLHNRRYADEQLPALIATGADLTVALADLDHFKAINDRLSHHVGDQVLVRVAQLLASELATGSPDGFAARLGGEEFLLVIPRRPARSTLSLLHRVRRRVATHDWRGLTRGLPVTVSIGVADLAGASEPTPQAILSTADTSLYAAKQGGRDRVVLLNTVDTPGRSIHDNCPAA